MHKEVAEKTSLAQQRAIDRINAKVGIRPCNFQTGDSAPRRFTPSSTSKARATLDRSLQDRTSFDRLHFILQHLVTGEECEVHGSRILFFRNSDFDVTKEVIEHLEYQTGELHTVSEFADVRLWQGSVEVKARWREYEAWEDT
jgi:hypothetical protein